MSDGGVEVGDELGGSVIDFRDGEGDAFFDDEPTSPITQTPSTCSMSTAPSTPTAQALAVPVEDGNDGLAQLDAVAEHMFQLQRKVRRLTQLAAVVKESQYFDDEDEENVRKEIAVAEEKLERIRASVRQVDGVFLLLTLKHREAVLEQAVKDGMLDSEHDKSMFYTLVRKQVYLTRLGVERCKRFLLS